MSYAHSLLGRTVAFLFIVQFVSDTTGYATVQPVNTAVISGTVASFYCSSNTSLLSWDFVPYPSGDSVTLAINCEVNPQYESIYSVTSSQSGHCDLNIISNSSVAGSYSCHEQFNTYTAKLIVLGAAPTATTNSSGEILFEGNYTTLICQVNFTGAISPSIKWLAPGNVPITNGSYYNNSKGLEAIVDVPAYSNSDWPDYICEVYFQHPPPDLTLNVSAPNITVYSCPLSISIAPNGGNIGQGQQLTCTVSGGYPSPSFSWKNLATGQVTSGQKVSLSSLGSYSYECTATNPFCTLTATASGTVVSSSTTSSDTTAIIVGICCGAASIIIIVIVIIVMYCLCRKRKGKKSEHPDSNNGERNAETETAPINYPRSLQAMDYTPPESLPSSKYRYPEVSSTYVDRIPISGCGLYSEHRSRYSDIDSEV